MTSERSDTVRNDSPDLADEQVKVSRLKQKSKIKDKRSKIKD
jgi:hypothetical protein